MLNKINTKNQNLSKIVAWCCGLGIMLWSILLTKKFINFGYYDWDLAIYAQAMWRMIHGSLNVSLFGMNFLGNHAEYVSFFIAPIYFLFPHPLTLLFLKIISFFTAAYILFHIAKKYLPGAISFVIFLLCIFYPANIFMLVFEFHFESLALPLLMGILWAFLEKKIKIFLILSFFLCLVKENMPLIVIMFGVCSLFRKETHKWLWGGIPILFGMIYFLVTLFYLIPLSRAGLPSTEHIYWGLFGHLSSTPLGIIKKLLLEPTFFLQQIITKQNIQYMQSLFTPLAY
ncbi:MAG TPA: DUF2079 domain-containing protein, partial [Candidatus Omnitrophota bacterium]|nr:DUF2079 domain-containing protein [Candidatus Omnitrophota bacterium]